MLAFVVVQFDKLYVDITIISIVRISADVTKGTTKDTSRLLERA